jgi:hypothetical protein
MKPFHTIAVPHQDILEGRLTMKVFAADLWEVSNNRGPDEYKDAEIFFRKTYLTEGLKNLLSVVERRVSRKGGDPVIQIQTPFGGGKTHALIAMYHKAEEWNAKRVVMVGTALGPEETLWGLIEMQLTGSNTQLTGLASPGRESIRKLLEPHAPVLILMDEVLEYITKAAAIKVGDSTLAAQTVAFLQELTETISSMGNVSLVVTLPSSIIEHYDEGAERLFQQLQKVSGRVEKIYTPVQEQEITRVIRARLFSTIKDEEIRPLVSGLVDSFSNESLLPAGTEMSEYRDWFIDSYPFCPEVIEVLYHRWGSFPTFQRTRGVLRLLSLVVHSLRNSSNPYITLADFDLSNQELRQELLKHIGSEYNSVIAADITDREAGSKKVDVSLGTSFQGLSLGTRASTTIFLYSFSGGVEKGTTLGDIKRQATKLVNPASIIAEALDHLSGKLFYLQHSGDRYFFNNQPNLNRILIGKMDNVTGPRIIEAEKKCLDDSLKGGKFKLYPWSENASDIADREEYKLVILKKEDPKLIEHISSYIGSTRRVFINTIFFLYPCESERLSFIELIKKTLAYHDILKDKLISLTPEQRVEVSKEYHKSKKAAKESTQNLYRMVVIPGKQPTMLGKLTFGDERSIDERVYEELRSEGELLERIGPKLLNEKYLSKRDYVFTEQIFQSALKTPGEFRPVSRQALENGIKEGIENGLFGLGELKDEKPVCEVFKKSGTPEFSSNEIIISAQTCKAQYDREKQSHLGEYQTSTDTPGSVHENPPVQTGVTVTGIGEKTTPGSVKNSLRMSCTIPKGKVSGLVGVINYLTSKYSSVKITLESEGGEITDQEFEEKIQEAFEQMGVDVRIEE